MKTFNNFSIYQYNEQTKPNQIKMATTLSIPSIPTFIVKYIATFLKTHNGIYDVEILISLFKAFTGFENDDLYTLYYKENVWQYLSDIMYDALDERYAYDLSNREHPYNLSPLDIAWVYEMTFADHYSQSISNNYNLKEFDDITNLLEETPLYDNETIMGVVGNHINIKYMKFITLLEKALMQNRGELLRFIYENTYSPIMAFYLYTKHNHVDYRTEENSLANDEGLLDLLISQGGYQKELLSLAITGLFNNDHIYVKKYSKTQKLEKHGVMPNPAVVNDILSKFPNIRNELIPNYMKHTIEMDTETGEWSEEELDELLPLDIWQQYKNTFEERVILNSGTSLRYAHVQNIRYNQMEDLYKESSKHFYDNKYDKHIMTIPKNEFIGKLLTLT